MCPISEGVEQQMISKNKFIEQKEKEIKIHFLSLDISNTTKWDMYIAGIEKGGFIALGF